MIDTNKYLTGKANIVMVEQHKTKAMQLNDRINKLDGQNKVGLKGEKGPLGEKGEDGGTGEGGIKGNKGIIFKPTSLIVTIICTLCFKSIY